MQKHFAISPLLTKVQPLSAHQACLFRGVPKQEQPLGTWPLLSPTFISVTGAGGEWGLSLLSVPGSAGAIQTFLLQDHPL